jgi:hypothetical protein
MTAPSIQHYSNRIRYKKHRSLLKNVRKQYSFQKNLNRDDLYFDGKENRFLPNYFKQRSSGFYILPDSFHSDGYDSRFHTDNFHHHTDNFHHHRDNFKNHTVFGHFRPFSAKNGRTCDASAHDMEVSPQPAGDPRTRISRCNCR